MEKLANIRLRRVNEWEEGRGPWLPLSDVAVPADVKGAIQVAADSGESEGIMTTYHDRRFQRWSWFQF